jgi:peptidoglycan/xylan/chitin deacetylase (PgdA/CDA1 family)
MKEITIRQTSTPKTKPDYSKLGFGKYFTDHMFLMDYTPDSGWHDPRIVPYGPISLDPSAMVLHYAQETFEGMKAYYAGDGRTLLFRPWDNNQQYRERAISHNNTLYIPIKFVCERFGLKYQLIKTPIPVIRVVSDAKLDANEFKDKYYDRIISEGRDFLNLNQSPSPSVPVTSVSPPPSKEPTLAPEVYLTFDCKTPDGLKEMIGTLDKHKISATFFLTEDMIGSERDLVLSIIGSGHNIGIYENESLAESQGDSQSIVEYVQRANRLLDSYTHTKTRLFRFRTDSPFKDDKSIRETLAESGYAVWDWTLNADSITASTNWQTSHRWISIIEQSAENGNPVVFRAGVKADLNATVDILLDYFDDEQAVFRLITPATESDKLIG